MKAYTSLEQSQKLAEILPIKSADLMWEYEPNKDTYLDKPTMIPIESYIFINDIPCWSLAALLNITCMVVGRVVDLDIWICASHKLNLSLYADNPIDACYEMILNLHEQNIL